MNAYHYTCSMKLRLLRFIGSFFVFYFVMEVLREVLLSRERYERFVANTLAFIELSLLSSLLFLLYAIVAYLLLFYFYKRVQKWQIFCLLVVAALSIIGLRYVLEEVVLKAITGYGNYYDGVTVHYYIFDNLYYAMLYSAFGITWFFINYSMYREQQQQVLLLENKKTELSYLRAQVNPHFLFNMLNNIYALINMGSDKALTATDKLSQLLRYSLYDADQLVTLDKELQSVNDYVALEELRFRESVQFITTTTPNLPTIKIMPFILLPLVENAFKHGLATNVDSPIELAIILENNVLTVAIENAIATGLKDSIGGIGIENLKKRLQLTYGANHTFNIINTSKRYTVQITLNLAT